jgi:GxxExxY protein
MAFTTAQMTCHRVTETQEGLHDSADDLPRSHGDTEMESRHSPDDSELAATNLVTQKIIACAIEVHRIMGPGLLERVYETAMCIEMDDLGLAYDRQVRLPAYYKGRALGEYRVDLIVGDLVVVEIKRVERMSPVFEAQLLNYMRLAVRRVGLLINFNTHLVKEGITRRIL